MAGNSYLLDTAIVVAYLNRDPVVLQHLQNSNFVVPSVVIGGTKGCPIPDNDIWIAATAMQYGLSLATRDKHFREIDGLSLVIW